MCLYVDADPGVNFVMIKILMCYSGNRKDDKPPGTKYFTAQDPEIEKVISYFDDISPNRDEMGFKMDADVGGGDIRYSGSGPNMGFETSVDNNVCGDARVKMDTDDDFNDEIDDDYIPSNEDVFKFYNKVKDEWIDNLQADFFY